MLHCIIPLILTAIEISFKNSISRERKYAWISHIRWPFICLLHKSALNRIQTTASRANLSDGWKFKLLGHDCYEYYVNGFHRRVLFKYFLIFRCWSDRLPDGSLIQNFGHLILNPFSGIKGIIGSASVKCHVENSN